MDELKSVASFVEKCKEMNIFLMSILEKSKQSNFSPPHDPPDFESDIPESHICNEYTIKLENENSSDNFKSIVKSESNLKNTHLNFDSTVIKNFHCANCGKGYCTKRELVVHIRTHSETKPFTCSLCSMTFKFRQSLQRHRLIHSTVRAYNCDICGKG